MQTWGEHENTQKDLRPGIKSDNYLHLLEILMIWQMFCSIEEESSRRQTVGCRRASSAKNKDNKKRYV